MKEDNWRVRQPGKGLIYFDYKLLMSLKQALLRKYFKRNDGGDSESQASSDEESNYVPSKSKSLFSEPKSWTRVRNLEQAL